jgi:hypothetical protein
MGILHGREPPNPDLRHHCHEDYFAIPARALITLIENLIVRVDVPSVLPLRPDMSHGRFSFVEDRRRSIDYSG